MATRSSHAMKLWHSLDRLYSGDPADHDLIVVRECLWRTGVLARDWDVVRFKPVDENPEDIALAQQTWAVSTEVGLTPPYAEIETGLSTVVLSRYNLLGVRSDVPSIAHQSPAHVVREAFAQQGGWQLSTQAAHVLATDIIAASNAADKVRDELRDSAWAELLSDDRAAVLRRAGGQA